MNSPQIFKQIQKNTGIRILFIGHDATRTGAPISLLNLIKWVQQNSTAYFVILLAKGGDLLKDYENLGETYIWEPQKKSLRYNLLNKFRRKVFHNKGFNSQQTQIINQLKANNFNCIFNNTVVNGLILKEVSKIIKAPVVSRIPELETTIQYYNKNSSADLTFLLSDKIIAVSQAVKNNLVAKHNVSEDKISIVYGTPPTYKKNNEFNVRELLSIPKEAFVVGGCGSLDWQKGFDIFIHVANEIINKKNQNDVYFLWVGGGSSFVVNMQIDYDLNKMNLQGRVFFVGKQNDILPYYHAMSIFLLTSREDSFPLVMVEAAREGLPVICFIDSGGAEEFVDTSIGSCVRYCDISEMSNQVLIYKQSLQKYNTASQKAKEKAFHFISNNSPEMAFEVITSIADM